MDPGAVHGHMPPLLRPDDHAGVRRFHGHQIPLEQNRLWSGPGWVLLGLLLHADPGRTRQWHVSTTENTLASTEKCCFYISSLWLSFRVGGERVLLLSAASWAVITAGTPLLAHLGSHQLFLMTLARILMGLLQGECFVSLKIKTLHGLLKVLIIRQNIFKFITINF